MYPIEAPRFSRQAPPHPPLNTFRQRVGQGSSPVLPAGITYLTAPYALPHHGPDPLADLSSFIGSEISNPLLPLFLPHPGEFEASSPYVRNDDNNYDRRSFREPPSRLYLSPSSPTPETLHDGNLNWDRGLLPFSDYHMESDYAIYSDINRQDLPGHRYVDLTEATQPRSLRNSIARSALSPYFHETPDLVLRAEFSQSTLSHERVGMGQTSRLHSTPDLPHIPQVLALENSAHSELMPWVSPCIAYTPSLWGSNLPPGECPYPSMYLHPAVVTEINSYDPLPEAHIGGIALYGSSMASVSEPRNAPITAQRTPHTQDALRSVSELAMGSEEYQQEWQQQLLDSQPLLLEPLSLRPQQRGGDLLRPVPEVPSGLSQSGTTDNY